MLEGWGYLAALTRIRAGLSEWLELLAVLKGDVELVHDPVGVFVVDELLRAGERLIDRRNGLLLDMRGMELVLFLLTFLQKS